MALYRLSRQSNCSLTCSNDKTSAKLTYSKLLSLFGRPDLDPVAKDVEDTLVRIIDTVCV